MSRPPSRADQLGSLPGPAARAETRARWQRDEVGAKPLHVAEDAQSHLRQPEWVRAQETR